VNVLISGGSRGLGAAIVRALLDEGHTVATFSRSRTPNVDEFETSGRFMWEPIDATDHAAMSRFVLAVAKKHGGIDALINNAAILNDGVFTTMRVEDIHQVVAVNLEAALLLTRACVKSMLVKKQGRIVNISSVNGVRGHAGVAVYSATKAAMDGFTRSLAREFGPRGIRVNSLAPGYLETEMTHGMTAEQKASIERRTPLRRLGKTDDIVRAVRFLIGEDSEFLTGHTLVVDGGLTC
jgi:3-oxoacyl-[acyl-carrier protein] reductase